jgi:hypothetical protein
MAHNPRPKKKNARPKKARTKKIPLSPMLVQYLAGLCVQKWGDDASVKEVTLGHMVFDQASDEDRDVDVTVTFNTPDGVYAFMGYEVKHERTPLDSTTVEQLAIKLKDMPGVTHRAIVSTSGYYKPAIKKAQFHGVDLYEIKDWTTPLEEQFPNLAPMKGLPAQRITGVEFLLQWAQVQSCSLDTPHIGAIDPTTPLFDAKGKKHSLYPNYETLGREMLVRSIDSLFEVDSIREKAEPLLRARRNGEQLPETPQWPYRHIMEMIGEEIYTRLSDNTLHRLTTITITGELRWQPYGPLHLAMEKVPAGEIFSAAVVFPNPVSGRMKVLLIPTQGRNLTLREVELDRNQRNSIRNLKVPATQDNPPRPSQRDSGMSVVFRRDQPAFLDAEEPSIIRPV